jgi:indolepyruvate ferredoxin oxidoreductase alpha subunit
MLITNLDEFDKTLKEEIAADEPSVIIAQRPCALLKKVKYKGQVIVNSEKCKYCKVCMRLGCPAIVDTGSGIHINDALCVGCDLCMKACKFGAMEKAGGTNA